MRNLILPVSLCMLMITSCVSKKKYVELENKYTDTKGNLQKLQLKQEEINRRVEIYNDRINSLKDDNANLEEENELKFDVNSDNIVISKKGRDIMNATLAKVNPEKLAKAKTLKDSLNLALSYNIISHTLGEAELLNSDELDIDIDETVVMISISDKLLFSTGSYRIKESAYSLITKIADIAEAEPSIDIMIEGHTDSQTISNAAVQDNWDLSVKRATSIVRLLQNKFKIDGNRLIASGRGDTVPLLPNTSSENRAKNRRTRIVILPNINKFFALLNSEN